jgi:hypothetical protein
MGTRWLLYDAGCSICAALAREVEALSGGRLRVRSLREPEVQALLDRARPGWQWEPMLVEIEGERVRVFAGLGMRARLVQVLGPVRALRVARAVARMGGPVLGVDWGRRQLLRQGGTIAALTLLNKLTGYILMNKIDDKYEYWHGFIIIKESNNPLILQDYQFGMPDACGVDDEGTTILKPKFITQFYVKNLEELSSKIKYPLYILRTDSIHGISLSNISLIQQPGYPPYGYVLTYSTYNNQLDVYFTSISIFGIFDFQKPLPFFIRKDEEVIKANFLPNPGLMVKKPHGFDFHWINHNVHYILSLEMINIDPVQIASNLVQF